MWRLSSTARDHAMVRGPRERDDVRRLAEHHQFLRDEASEETSPGAQAARRLYDSLYKEVRGVHSRSLRLRI